MPRHFTELYAFERISTGLDVPCPDQIHDFKPYVIETPENCALRVHSKPECSYTFYYDPDNGHCYCKRLNNTCNEIGKVPYSRYRLAKGMFNMIFSV